MSQALAGATPAAGNLASQPTKIKRYKGLTSTAQVKAKSQRLEVWLWFACLDRYLRADLDDAAAGDLEIVGGIVGRAAERDEQPVLPARHAGMGRGLQRPARQEERGRHDVELPAELAGDRQCLRHVRRFHEAELQRHLREGRADLLQLDALGRIDARGLCGFDGENDILLVKHFVVFQAV